MQLSGGDYEKLVDLMVKAYPNKIDLEQMLRFNLEENLDEIAQGQTIKENSFNLIKWAESRDKLKDLLEAIHKDRPHLQDNIRELLEIYFRKENKPFVRYEISPYPSPYELKSEDIIRTFTARASELEHLERLLINSTGQQRCSVVGISGIGGVGKTALACYFAEINYQQHFYDGVICLRVDDKSLTEIALEFASYYPIKIDDRDKNRGASHIIQKIFKTKKALLIFDNAEDSDIKALFPKPFQDKYSLIVTTRDKLLISALNIPHKGQLVLSTFEPNDSWKLLENLLGSQRLEDERTAVERIIELVGNLPLALNIIGKILTIEDSITEYEALLRQEKQRLLDERVSEKDINVRASLELSLNLLKKRNQENTINFFACLSVCSKDGFSFHTAKAASGLDKEDTHTHLRNLRQLSLIEGSQHTQKRYSFHPLIYLFAQDLLSKNYQLEQQVQKRYTHFYQNFVKYKNFKNKEINKILKSELNNIVLVAQWLKSERIADYDFAFCLIPFFNKNGNLREAIDIISIFISLANQNSDIENIVKLSIQKVKYLLKLDEQKQAKQESDLIISILDKIDKNDIEIYADKATWLIQRGRIFQKQGDLDEAIEYINRSLEIHQELNDERGVAMSLNTLAGVYKQKGDLDQALKMYQQSLKIKEKIGDKEGIIIALNSISQIYNKLKQYDNAVEILKKCIYFERENNNLTSLSIQLYELARICNKLERYDDAIILLEECVVIGKQLKDEPGLAKTYHELAINYTEKKEFDNALHYFELNIVLSKKQTISIPYNAIGRIFLEQGKIKEAAVKFRQSFEYAEKLKYVSDLEKTLPQLIRTLIKLGERQEALDYCNRALAIDSQNRTFIQQQKQLLKS
ncbi:tetratricopeptide repeat protein [Nostoc sp. MS1]|uniref:tetratricopeptide repeat protein n=1 Tax=Nostoc sp. MS1 TaxID=2764711 RepID=UPI001CC5B72F|nr:tetratricopeptide repeat protein [Nostoc sp. MS1]BCL34474.1 ATPase [Nostoc sp. MS1]